MRLNSSSLLAEAVEVFPVAALDHVFGYCLGQRHFATRSAEASWRSVVEG